MFTGIVLGTASISKIIRKTEFQTHILEFPKAWLEGLQIGASVAHNGCCLTVTKIEGTHVYFDVIDETLRVTNLKQLQEGDQVNIERAAQFGDDIGGHLMSGHIASQAEIVEVNATETNYQVWFEVPSQWMRFILTKGYVGIDGISLTIGEVQDKRFCVHLIPETLSRTTLSTKGKGATVNIEIDPQTQAIVSTVERVLAQQSQV
tara:strand:+ start:1440 stop:2054 length:615 start_codon:yes stop_codon:yes gene_type:complete